LNEQPYADHTDLLAGDELLLLRVELETCQGEAEAPRV
jgi:hypothetical protein